MNILVCCACGFSTSILVKSMRAEVKNMNRSDIKIAAIGVDQVYEHLYRADIVLIAPQIAHEYSHLKEKAESFHKPVYIIDPDDYGNMDGATVLRRLFHSIDETQREEIKMDKVSALIEKKLMPIAVKVGSNRVLTIIRNAMCSVMALLIIGSICILLSNFPIAAVAEFMEPANPFFNAVYGATSGMMGIYTAAAMAYFAAVEYKTDIFSSIVTSVSAFMLSQLTVEGAINMDGLGSMGLLTAMVIGYTTVFILDLFKKKNLVIRMPEGVPEAVSESFTSLIPAALILFIFGSVSLIFGFDINEVFATIMSPLSKAINTPWGYAIYHMLCGLVFFCGINSAVVIGVVQAFIMQNSVMNEAAFQAGESLKYAATYATDTMMWAGGTGATIGLMILMAFFAKSKSFKSLGRLSIGPGIFNINEPIIFGTPICFNPVFLLPFVLLPGILAFATFIMMDNGIIAMASVGNVPWTLPPIVIGWVMSNGAISTTIWSFLIVVISVVVYYPFFRMADKKEYENELAGEKASLEKEGA